MNARALAGYGMLSAIAVVLDQWIKWLVEAYLPFHEMVELVPFFALYRTYNPGIAFSMLAWLGGGGLVVLTLSIVVFVGWLAVRTGPDQTWARIGFALIIGGAIGNLIDRVALGHVIDYFLFHTPVWSFAIFNLADVFITFGAGFVILEELLGWRRARKTLTPDK